MDEYLSDEEQLQKIKEWWKKYGSSILTGVIVFLVVSFGWRYWQHYKSTQAEQASIIYQEMVAANMAQQNDNFQLFAKHLLKDYKHTPYSSLAALMMAKKAVEQNNFQAAERHLEWVINHASSKSLRQIARNRAARILLAMKQPKAALKLLQTVDDKTFSATTLEIKGDIYLSLGNKTAALKSYQDALQNAPQNSAAKALLTLKIDQLK